MSQSNKPKCTVRVYYQFAPKGWQTSPGEIALEDVRKYMSNKPLRRGPERRPDDGKDRAGPEPGGDKPHEPGTP